MGGHPPVTDDSARDDRGARRTRQLGRGIGSSVVARGVTSLSPLALTPVALGYLGAEQYGAWMAIASVTSMFLWADLGLGNTLLTRLTPLVVDKRWDEARNLISAAYRALAAVGALGLLLALLAGLIVPWRAVLNADESARASLIAGICLSAFAINIPLSLVHRLLFATQRVTLSNGLQVVGAVAGLAGALAAVWVNAGGPWVVAVATGGPVLVNGVATLLVLSSFEHMRPRWRGDEGVTRDLLATGMRFVAIAVVTSVALNIDNVIVARVVNAEEVASFAVVAKVFLALGLLVTVVGLPMWPANAEALARGDHDWVRRTTIRMMLLCGGAVLAVGIGLMLFIGPLVDVLGAGQVTAPYTLVLGFVLLWTAFGVASPLFMVQNAAGVLAPQLLGWTAYLVVTAPAKFLVADAISVDFIPWVSLMAYVLIVLPAAIVGARKSLRSTAGATLGGAGIEGNRQT